MRAHDAWELLTEAAPVRDGELVGSVDSPEARGLLAAIVATPYADGGDESRSPFPRRRPSVSWPRVGAIAAALALVVAITGAVGTLRPTPAAAGVAITEDGEWFVVTVTDLRARPEAMRRALQKRGLDVELKLVAASPSRVGDIVALADSGASGIESLWAPGCVETICGPIGIRVPTSFGGHAEVTLGRSPRTGEDYITVASAFAPGEALHCSGLLGARVRDVLDSFAGRGLEPRWNVEVRRGHWENLNRPPAAILDHYVDDVLPKSPTEVIVRTSARSLVERAADDARIAAYLDRLAQGC